MIVKKKLTKNQRRKNKAKGSINENRSRVLLEAMGYQVTVSKKSEGVFDLIAINEKEVLLIQVKTNKWPVLAEINNIKDFKCPSICVKLIHRWNTGIDRPLVRVIE